MKEILDSKKGLAFEVVKKWISTLFEISKIACIIYFSGFKDWKTIYNNQKNCCD